MATDTDLAYERLGSWIRDIKAVASNKRAGDERADRESLERAADLELIYSAMEWISEMPKPKAKRVGRRVDPKSREQFAKWVRQRWGWGSQSYLSYLSEAQSFHLQHALEMKTTERTLRPLWKLRAEGYGDYLLEVWQRAVKTASDHPTSADVRREVTAFLQAHKPPIKNAASDPRTEAERRQAKQARTIAAFEDLLSDGDNLLSKETLNKMMTLYNERQREIRAALS